MMLLSLLTASPLGTNLVSLQTITGMLHLCFGVAFLIIFLRFCRDYFIYKHRFPQAIQRRKAPLIVLAIVYAVTMFAIYFLW
ncbi:MULTISPECIES: hypothetical protein [unclassified Myroides]|uniref:hypothetical protein n=1 Tax=unclassified Myroides TaxID=2642485 RepID=UPI002577A733|nr:MULTISPECIES: hypothetical protein [unclassified Myroides]